MPDYKNFTSDHYIALTLETPYKIAKSINDLLKENVTISSITIYGASQYKLQARFMTSCSRYYGNSNAVQTTF